MLGYRQFILWSWLKHLAAPKKEIQNVPQQLQMLPKSLHAVTPMLPWFRLLPLLPLSCRGQQRYLLSTLPPEQIPDLICADNLRHFSNLDEAIFGCTQNGFALASGDWWSLEDMRSTTWHFYESGMPLLSSYQLVETILQKKKKVSCVCPHAVLQSILLQSERLLVKIYTFSTDSADYHAVSFSEASALNLEFNAIRQWLQQVTDAKAFNLQILKSLCVHRQL